MADAKNKNQAVALMEVAKMVNDLRNAIVLVGLVMTKEMGQDTAADARNKLEELAVKEGLLIPR